MADGITKKRNKKQNNISGWGWFVLGSITLLWMVVVLVVPGFISGHWKSEVHPCQLFKAAFLLGKIQFFSVVPTHNSRLGWRGFLLDPPAAFPCDKEETTMTNGFRLFNGRISEHQPMPEMKVLQQSGTQPFQTQICHIVIYIVGCASCEFLLVVGQTAFLSGSPTS